MDSNDVQEEARRNPWDGYVSYILTSNFQDLQEAGAWALGCYSRTPQNPIVPYVLARTFVRRFLHLRELGNIISAITLLKEARRLCPDDNSLLRERIDSFVGFSYLVRDNQLEGSVELHDLHVQIPSTSERRNLYSFLPQLGEENEVFDYFLQRIRGSGGCEASFENRDSAIQLCRQALKVFSFCFDSRKVAHILHLLGFHLFKRFSSQGEQVLDEIDEAINCLCKASELPMDPHLLGDCFQHVSTALSKRSKMLGRREDLDNALHYAKEAMKLPNCGSKCFASRLSALATATVYTYLETGEVNELQGAIRFLEDALKIIKDEGISNEVPGHLLTLAKCLQSRYHMLGQLGDLRHAIRIGQQALDLSSHSDPFWMYYRVGLSDMEAELGEQIEEEMHFKDRAIKRLTAALSAETQELQKCDRLMAEGRLRYFEGNWDEAIPIMRELIANPHPRFLSDTGWHYILLLRSLEYKRRNFREKGQEDHEKVILDELIETADRVLTHGIEHSSVDQRIIVRGFLGVGLQHRFRIARNRDDLKMAQKILLEGVHVAAGAPIHRISASKPAMHFLCHMGMWYEARQLSKEIMDLIVVASGRFLDGTDKQYRMQLFSDEIPKYASIALQAGSDVFEVVDMLETCRGSILGHMIDHRTDLDDLREVASKEADRFAALRDQVNSDNHGQVVDGKDIHLEVLSRRITAEEEMRACLEEIRKLDGFQRFLLGPTRSELKEAAAQGPIVSVIVTNIRSDAIIVTDDNDPVLLPLPELIYETVEDYRNAGLAKFSNIKEQKDNNKKYLRFLKWLWEMCVNPVFQKLDKLQPDKAKFRVWWLGIGLASSLPFHVAGIYTGRARGSALTRAISSYIPSLKFLMHGRRKLKKSFPDAEVQQLPRKPELLMVTMPSTPDLPDEEGSGTVADLPGTVEEAENVEMIVGDAYSFHHKCQPSAEQVKEKMRGCEIVHFACHGKSIVTNPLSGHLLLQTGGPESEKPIIDKLTVADVVALNLSNCKLAFLSACYSAENENEGLLDESLHLAAGFWIAGYLHTVGNLWKADDDVSVEVVEGFYRHLLEAGELGDGENVAKALNEALLSVSAERSKDPLSWAQYVHFGV